jgi:hypothetical protein
MSKKQDFSLPMTSDLFYDNLVALGILAEGVWAEKIVVTAERLQDVKIEVTLLAPADLTDALS